MNGELVSWVPYHTLPNFPFYALEVSSLPYFISEDFETMCEFNQEEKRMHIVQFKTDPESNDKSNPKSNDMKKESKVLKKEIIGTLPEEALHL